MDPEQILSDCRADLEEILRDYGVTMSIWQDLPAVAYLVLKHKESGTEHDIKYGELG